ncbi:hypothetical protein [Halorussus aquaticus]|uniref:Uncharacterized protein n=1 Tax=Halorussus aquaticus TaxID=2953748 RepID=A0ABD5Q987_9EURY|nr:hypothetical protein [Halorussus aquaticus]
MTGLSATTKATDHLEEALDAENADDKNFHIRQALQLIDAETSK